MKRILISLSALALVACTPGYITPGLGSVIVAPVEYANRTAMDEQAAVGVELGYKAFRQTIELGVDSGFIKGERAARAAAADRRAYAALLVVRQAYKTANAQDFLMAIRSGNIAIEQAVAAVKGN